MIAMTDVKELFKIARQAISEQEIQKPKNKTLLKKAAVFVTLQTYPENKLRGCIGYSDPQFPLYEAVYKAANLAAFGDTRFSPLRKSELDKVTLEISILSPLKSVSVKKPEDYLTKIKPHEDGLVLQNGLNSGLFLPQVWEQIPKPENFLDHLCLKTGIPPGSWKSKDSKLFKFSVVAFKESKPLGEIKKSD